MTRFKNYRSEFVSFQLIGAAFTSLLVVFVMSVPFSIPNKIAISAILGVLFYGFFEYCVLPENLKTMTVKSLRIPSLSHPVYSLVYGLALVLTFVSPNISNKLYLDWIALGVLGFARLAASMLLTSLLPGYAILRILKTSSSKTRITLPSRVGTIVLSVLLSIFLTSVVAYMHWTRNGGFEGLDFTLWLANASIFAVYVLSSIQKSTRQRVKLRISVNSFYQSLILVSTLTFLLWVYFSTHYAPQTLQVFHDELRHAGFTQQLLRGWHPWQAAEAGSNVYPYFFHLTLASSVLISGAPLINVYLSFFFLFILPAGAFYFMVQEVIPNSKFLPLVATIVFTVFSGFGWVYATAIANGSAVSEVITIAQASSATYDIIYSTWLPIYIAPYTLDLTIFFVLIGLSGSTRSPRFLSQRTLFILTAILVTLGSLIHVEKILMFGIILASLSMLHIFKANFLHSPKTVLSAFITALLISATLNFFAPYSLSQVYFSSVLNICLIGAATLLLVLAFERLSNKLGALSLKGVAYQLMRAIPYAAFGLYLILAGAFLYFSPSYVFDITVVPLWFLPLKIGVVAILFLASLFSGALENRRMRFFLTLFVIAVVVEIYMYHLPSFSIPAEFPEFRVIRDVLWPFYVIVGVYSIRELTRFCERVPKKALSLLKTLRKPLAAGALLFLVFVSSVPSHLLKVQYFASIQPTLSSEERDALEFLNTLRIPSGSYVLAGFQKDKTYAATGALAYGFDDQVFTPLIFNSESPSTGLTIFSYLNISHTFLTSQDKEFLKNKYEASFFNHLETYFYPIFESGNISILGVPTLTPPLDSSEVVVITGDLSPNAANSEESFLFFNDNFSYGWTNSVSNNVVWQNFTHNNDVAVLEAMTISGEQAAVFYTKDLENPIEIKENTTITLDFRSTNNISYVILDVIFDDETEQRIRLNNRGYINSPAWTEISDLLHQGKSIRSIRIGITDNSKGGGNQIGVELDSISILRNFQPSDYYASSLLVAQMGIQYTVASEFDPFIWNCETIFFIDDVSCPQYTRLLDWTQDGGTLMVINSHNRGVFADFLQITENNTYVQASGIMDKWGASQNLPSTILPKLQVGASQASVLAHYTDGNTSISPFIIMQPLGKGKIIYLEWSPILDSLARSEDLTEVILWIRNLLGEHVVLRNFDYTAYKRGFYAKNAGKISAYSETAISTSSIVSGIVNVAEFALNFSGTTQRNQIVSNGLISSMNLSGQPLAIINVDGITTVIPIDSSSYSKLRIEGEMCVSFYLNNISQVDISISDEELTKYSFSDGTLSLSVLNASGIEMIVRDPTLVNYGTTIFDSLFISHPFEMLSSGERKTIDGYSRFRVTVSEKNVTLLDDFEVNGSLQSQNSNIPRSSNDFFSMQFPAMPVTCIIVAVIAVVLIILRKRQQSRV